MSAAGDFDELFPPVLAGKRLHSECKRQDGASVPSGTLREPWATRIQGQPPSERRRCALTPCPSFPSFLPLDTSLRSFCLPNLGQLLRSGSLLHPLNRERLRQSLRQRPLEELQEELSTIQQALASASGIVLRTRGTHADLQPDSSESEADQSENGIGRAQPPVAEFVGRRPIFRVVRVEDAVSPAGSLEKDEAKLCGWLSSRVESPEDSWEDMPFDKDTAIVAALADLSPRQILKARHVASNPIASTQELHQSTPVLSICDEGSVAVRGYVGLEVDPSPPHAILGIGLMDVNGILQGEEGYANPCIEQGDRLVAIDGHECVLAPMAQVERLMTGEVCEEKGESYVRPAGSY